MRQGSEKFKLKNMKKNPYQSRRFEHVEMNSLTAWVYICDMSKKRKITCKLPLESLQRLQSLEVEMCWVRMSWQDEFSHHLIWKFSTETTTYFPAGIFLVKSVKFLIQFEWISCWRKIQCKEQKSAGISCFHYLVRWYWVLFVKLSDLPPASPTSSSAVIAHSSTWWRF